MKSLDKDIYRVDTKGTDAEKASIAKTRNRYKELEAQKSALEAELGEKTTNIRKKFEAEVESETAKRLIKERELREAENKRALQEAMGLRVADDVLLIGMVSRLTWQKGVYLLVEKMYELMGQDVQLVILGTGETNIENEFKQIEYRFPRRAVYYCGYNEELAHQIYAGCDAFLMPSLFEPCGLSQLISMRYGTLPIVRETGGLKDTVMPYNQYTKEGTGFTFANFNADEMMNMIKYCIYVYYMQKEDWKTLVANAMKADVSWEASCRKYFELYDSMF
jgi:starch synthase